MLQPQEAFIIALVILLGCALLAGEIAIRLGQLPLVGQLVVGVILGPTLLGPTVGLNSVSPELGAIQFLATFLLLFMAGLEVDPADIFHIPLHTLLLGLLLFFIPFGLTLVVTVAIYPNLGLILAMFIATTLSITALPIMAVMVREFGMADRQFGKVVLVAALVNELAAITVFAVLLQIHSAGDQLSLTSVLEALGSTAVFLVVVFGAYELLRRLRVRRSARGSPANMLSYLRSREAGFALLMVVSLGAALFSDFLGLTFVIGAFYAGILVTPSAAGPDANKGVQSALNVIMWGFFIPLFFAITGSQTNLRLLAGTVALVAFFALLLVAMVSKIGVGAGFTRLTGWSLPDSFALGFMVNSRGAVGSAMAVILYADNIISVFWFTIIVAVGLVCTMVAPIGAVSAWRSEPGSRADLLVRMPSLAGPAPPAAAGPATARRGGPLS
ncbi:MAG: cation:proton antiporter [Thermoplasmata archaeon]|nr:cation:proton antiporter [Thermoplasmata archaeon]